MITPWAQSSLFQEHRLTPATPIKRIQENVLARQERRLLNWICPRLPQWVTPDQLTFLALVAAGVVFAGYALSAYDRNWLWASVIGYVVHWFGDSLDGSLARYRSIERPRYGYFIDHSADVLGALLILTGLGVSPYIRLDVALVALAGYYMLAAHAFLSAKVVGELKLSHVAAGPTELRLILIGLTVAMYVLGQSGPRFESLSVFDAFVGAVGALLIILFIVQTLAMAKRLTREGE
jgi:phosphatidylglycerophosphate synthase